jgi:tetratricopeptide (TPR) repeat protein/uncharacterized protein (AIM24 family)
MLKPVDQPAAVPEDVERRLTEHLGRASELLRAEKLEPAEAEITAALALRPDDLRARNLRGLLHFRSGRYEEARTIYVELSSKHPEDAALRLNLGLVELRMGHHAEAADNLKRVIAVEPDNAKAQGYLGLALMRLGELGPAREALLKAGQTELAKQVEERMAQGDAERAAAARTEINPAAVEGARALEAKPQPFAAVELETPLDEARRGAWQLRHAGARAPLPGPEGHEVAATPLKLSPPVGVAAFATARLVQAGPHGEPFALAEGGMLMLRVDGRLVTRTFGAIASTGSIIFEPLYRRVRGRSTEEPFGEGIDALFVAVGQGAIAVASRGAHFQLLSLSDDILYVRESALFGFEESLHWETGRVPGSGDDSLRVAQFRGTGRVALRTQRSLFTLKIEPETPLLVESTTLCGWIGRVVPRVLHNEQGPTPYVECTGEGVIVLEEPPPL